MKRDSNDIKKPNYGRGLHFKFALACFVILPAIVPVNAQQITGTPGSPSATTTIDGRYLPAPPQPFGGEINPNALQSKPYWPARVVPPKGAPNILLIMTDDVGFGAPSTFGGESSRRLPWTVSQRWGCVTRI